MARKPREDGGIDDSWMNTYADMVTLLLSFFALLLSMSNTDQEKLNAFIQSFSALSQESIEEMMDSTVQGNGKVTEESDINELYLALKGYVEEHNQTDMVELSMLKDVIYIRFSSSLFFEPDQYVLRQSSKPMLKFIGDGIKQYEDKIRMVNILGFTATVENGTYWMLSGERAATVATYFNYTSNFPSDKLTVIGYGNQYPVASNETEAGRKKNRRVELVIVGEESARDFNITDALGEFYDNGKYPKVGNPGDVYRPNPKQISEKQDVSESENKQVSTKQQEPGISPYED